jgi:hypothetical protein
MVRLTSLVLEGSPRQAGQSETHIRVLAGVDGQLPPILVHRPSMRVLDGMHRVRAAMLRGEEAIRAVFFDGDEREAFVEAVRANVPQGLPLTLADRKAAARRIVALYPGWSDRRIAAAAGLSPATVKSVRDAATARSGQLDARVGRDGRVRPVDGSNGRRRAASVLAERPDASLREVARAAGVSIGTAGDVRRRVQEGRDPVPTRRARHQRRSTANPPATGGVTYDRHVAVLAGTEPELARALELLHERATEQPANVAELIDVLLAEHLEDQAWQVTLDHFHQLPQHRRADLLELRQATRPDQVQEPYRQLVEEHILDSRDKRRYQRAIILLRRLRNAHRATDDLSGFDEYLASLRVRHKRRPTFLAKLDAARL